MAAGTWTPVNSTRTKIWDGTLATSGTFKIALFDNTATINTSSTLYSGLSGEVGETNTGYTTGGQAITPALSGTTSVTWKGTADAVWTAGTADLVFKTAVIYETSSSQIMCYCLGDSGGADVTTTDGNDLTIDLTTNAVGTLA